MLTHPEIAQSLLAAGESKARLPFGKMLLLAILAGAYIALAGVGATAAAVTVESGSLAKLLSACVFPAGLSMVILAGSELFTGNCLMVMALLERRITPAQLLRNWLTVYLGNAVGGAAVAALAVYSHTASLFGDGLARSMASIAESKAALGFGDAAPARGPVQFSGLPRGVDGGSIANARRGRSSRSFSPSCSLSSAAMSTASRTCTTCPPVRLPRWSTVWKRR